MSDPTEPHDSATDVWPLGQILHRRATRTGQAVDLDVAVATMDRLFATMPARHRRLPYDRAFLK